MNHATLLRIHSNNIFRSANIPFDFMSHLICDQFYFHWLYNIVLQTVTVCHLHIASFMFPFTILPCSNGFFNASFAMWINTSDFHIAHAHGAAHAHTRSASSLSSSQRAVHIYILTYVSLLRLYCIFVQVWHFLFWYCWFCLVSVLF